MTNFFIFFISAVLTIQTNAVVEWDLILFPFFDVNLPQTDFAVLHDFAKTLYGSDSADKRKLIMTSPKDNKTQTCSSANCTLFIQGQFLQGLITFQNEEIIDYGDAVSNSFKASYSTNKFFYVATDIPCHMFDQYKYVSSVLNETALSLFLQTGEIVVKIFYINTNYTVPEPCVQGQCFNGYQCQDNVCVGPGPSTTFATVAPCELDSLSRFGSAFEQVETTISELTTVANQNQPSRILAQDSGSTTTTTQSSDLSDPNKPLLYAIITICVTVIVVALCCGCICIIKMRYRFSTLRINFYSRNPFRRNASPSTVVPNEYAMAPKFGSMKAVDFDKWEIQVTNLVVNKSEKLGSGAFAAVYKGYLKGKNPLLENLTFSLEMAENIGNEVAVKMLHTHSDDLSREELRKEIDFMKTLGYHPHVLNMIGCVSSIYDPLLIVEYCANGDLLTMLRKHKDYVLADGKEDCPAEADFCLEMRDLLSFAWQVSDGMVYLSLKNFIHRDVAARNILITKKMVAKVADFGLCRYTQEALYTTKGGKLPIKWMALEALKLAEFTTKSDVWSYGVLLFELFSLGDNPYPSVQPSDMIDHLLQGNRLEKPDLCPDEIYLMMQEMWNSDPNKRPTFEVIRQRLSSFLEVTSDSYGYIQMSPEYGPLYTLVEPKPVPAPNPTASSVEEVVDETQNS